MTRQRNDEHSTEFGLWLRKQSSIDSSLGFVTSNIDYLWENYKTGLWMFLEEKRHQSPVPYSQKLQFIELNKRQEQMRYDKYRGFHLVVFEKTSPLDGRIYLDRKLVSPDELLIFLRFEAPLEKYATIPEFK